MRAIGLFLTTLTGGAPRAQLSPPGRLPGAASKAVFPNNYRGGYTLNRHWHQRSEKLRSCGRSIVRCTLSALLLGLVLLALLPTAQADNFYKVYYDAGKDDLVVSITYRGTNPDHTFSLKWGRCKNSQGGVLHEIAGDVLDSQWQDDAQSDFKKTVRFSLADFRCRPATVTLRTAPRFLYTLLIPAVNVRHP
jgi:hypothetical protein